MPIFLRALALLGLATSDVASPDFCVGDASGFIVALASPCPTNSSPLRAVGANLFDVFWGAWGTAGPNGTLATSLQAVRDARASGIRVARAFAVPFSYRGWAWAAGGAARDAYWAAAAAVIGEAERAGLAFVLSLGHGCPDSTAPCNPAVIYNETYRDFIINASSQTRGAIRAYHADFVARFRGSRAVLMWELGNEMNLGWDGCTYDKSDGAFFTSAEGLAYLRAAAADIRAVDASARPINTGMGSPRSRATALAAAPNGGRGCVTPENPKGDCAFCVGLPADTMEETGALVRAMYKDFDMVSSHYYGCAPPFGNYSWCTGDNSSTLPLKVFKAAADALNKPLYVGEFGDPNLDWRAPGGRAITAAMATEGVPLSTSWAYACPSHDRDSPSFAHSCLHPGLPSAEPWTTEVLAIAAAAENALNGVPPNPYILARQMLPPPRAGASADPACLDGTAYGYYAHVGRDATKWIVSMDGGGWCPDLYNCFLRTEDFYANASLGSSRNWLPTAYAMDFGAQFADWSYLLLPYCSGDSFSGLALEPAPTPYGNFSNATIYFRGAANLEAALADALARAGAAGRVAEVLVTGGSAGGMSTVLHVDRIGALAGAARVAGVPQAGFFAEWNATCVDPEPGAIWCNATDQYAHLFHIANVSGALAPACLADHADEPWRCFLVPTAQAYVAAPLFFWQSAFDHFQLRAFVSVACALVQAYNPPWVYNVSCDARDTDAIASFGALFMEQFAPVLAAPGPHRAAFLTSCVLHGMDYHYLAVGDTDIAPIGERGTSPAVALNTWYAALYAADPPAVDNDYKWVESLRLPRVDNPLACPPFTFAGAAPQA